MAPPSMQYFHYALDSAVAVAANVGSTLLAEKTRKKKQMIMALAPLV